MASVNQRNKMKQAARALPVLAATEEQRHEAISRTLYIGKLEDWLEDETLRADELDEDVAGLEQDVDDLLMQRKALMFLAALTSAVAAVSLVLLSAA